MRADVSVGTADASGRDRNNQAPSFWCNAIVNAVITTGFLAPLAAAIVGLTAPADNLGFLVVTNGGALVLGIGMHRYGQAFLSEIEG